MGVKSLGVYLSYPFCAQKCTFCNFASDVFPRDLEKRYLAALRAELAACDWPWTPETVYLGGGSPNRIPPRALQDLLDAIPGRPWREATIEATPGAVMAELARAWRKAGIDRVSLGVQSFVPAEIAGTGRKHTAARVAEEVAVLRDAGILNFNIDLIAGLPGQTPATWRESLDWIERLAAPHVSVYMLEIDEDSRLGAEILRGGSRYGAAKTPPEDTVADLYETAADRLAAMGILRYEISNFARPGFESRHNLKYWTLDPYAGFGADAHSFDGILRRSNVESAAEYVERIERGASPCASEEPAHPAEERFFVGLRLEAGIEPRPDEWQRFEAPIRRFVEEGLLEVVVGQTPWSARVPLDPLLQTAEPTGGSAADQGVRPTIPAPTLRLTRRGVLLSNEVFREFLES
jgi:oxygen-independent coproporphyrinogen-3 oxidase